MSENVETKTIPVETIQNCIEALEQALEDQWINIVALTSVMDIAI